MAKDNVQEIERKIKSILDKNITATITTTKFRNKRTGEIATQIPLFEIGEWEKL